LLPELSTRPISQCNGNETLVYSQGNPDLIANIQQLKNISLLIVTFVLVDTLSSTKEDN